MRWSIADDTESSSRFPNFAKQFSDSCAPDENTLCVQFINHCVDGQVRTLRIRCQISLDLCFDVVRLCALLLCALYWLYATCGQRTHSRPVYRTQVPFHIRERFELSSLSVSPFCT